MKMLVSQQTNEQAFKHSDNDLIKVEGILQRGFGIMPRIVADDNRLTIEAKGIYAFFISYAGNDMSAFPSARRILARLNISAARYYKHRELLLKYGYVDIQQQYDEEGRFSNNLYIIKQFVKVDEDAQRKTRKNKKPLQKPSPEKLAVIKEQASAMPQEVTAPTKQATTTHVAPPVTDATTSYQQQPLTAPAATHSGQQEDEGQFYQQPTTSVPTPTYPSLPAQAVEGVSAVHTEQTTEEPSVDTNAAVESEESVQQQSVEESSEQSSSMDDDNRPTDEELYERYIREEMGDVPEWLHEELAPSIERIRYFYTGEKPKYNFPTPPIFGSEENVKSKDEKDLNKTSISTGDANQSQQGQVFPPYSRFESTENENTQIENTQNVDSTIITSTKIINNNNHHHQHIPLCSTNTINSGENKNGETAPASTENSEHDFTENRSLQKVTGDGGESSSKEQNEKNQTPHITFKQVIDVYEEVIPGSFSSYVYQRLGMDYDDFGGELLIEALRIADERNVRNYRYVEGILRRWKQRGIRTLADVHEDNLKQKNYKHHRQLSERELQRKEEQDAIMEEYKKKIDKLIEGGPSF